MGKINNTNKYNIDNNISANDMVIGTDADDNNKTKNFTLEDIAQFVSAYVNNGGSTPVIQNNKVVVLTKGEVVGESGASVEFDVNNGTPFTINEDELYVIAHTYSSNNNGNNTIHTKYWLFKKGKGDYGIAGDNTTADDYFLIRNEETVTPLNSNVYYIQYVSMDAPSNAVNASTDTYNIATGQDTYFIIYEELNTNNFERKIYRYIGNAGTYGFGGSATSSADFILIEDLTNPQTQIINNTSELTNDGANGTDPFITINDLPADPVYSLNLNGTEIELDKDGIEVSNIDIQSVNSNIQSDWNQTDNTQDDYIENKPINTSDFNNDGANGTDPFITINDLPADPVYGLSGGTGSIELNRNGVQISSVSISGGSSTQSDWDETDNTQSDYIKNKPELTNIFNNNGALIVDNSTSTNHEDNIILGNYNTIGLPIGSATSYGNIIVNYFFSVTYNSTGITRNGNERITFKIEQSSGTWRDLYTINLTNAALLNPTQMHTMTAIRTGTQFIITPETITVDVVGDTVTKDMHRSYVLIPSTGTLGRIGIELNNISASTTVLCGVNFLLQE